MEFCVKVIKRSGILVILIGWELNRNIFRLWKRKKKEWLKYKIECKKVWVLGLFMNIGLVKRIFIVCLLFIFFMIILLLFKLFVLVNYCKIWNDKFVFFDLRNFGCLILVDGDVIFGLKFWLLEDFNGICIVGLFWLLVFCIIL